MLRALQVLDCVGSSYIGTVLRALDWVLSHASAQNTLRTAVVSLAVQSPFCHALNMAVANVMARGLVVVVPAGDSAKVKLQSARPVVPHMCVCTSHRVGSLPSVYCAQQGVPDVPSYFALIAGFMPCVTGVVESDHRWRR